jgi:WD40 repeat protein
MSVLHTCKLRSETYSSKVDVDMYPKFQRIVLIMLFMFTMYILLPGNYVATVQGQTASITAIAWSPDVIKFATGDDAGVIKIWNASTNQILLTLTGHTAGSTPCDGSDGTRLASVGDDKSVESGTQPMGNLLCSARSYHRGCCGGLESTWKQTRKFEYCRRKRIIYGSTWVTYHRTLFLDLWRWLGSRWKQTGRAIPVGTVLVLNTATFEFANGLNSDLPLRGNGFSPRGVQQLKIKKFDGSCIGMQ